MRNSNVLLCWLAVASVGLAQLPTVFEVQGAQSGDQFGEVLVNMGDLNGDGIEEIAVGSPAWGSADEGAVYVLDGKDGSVIASRTSLTPSDRLGHDLDLMGDVDGDGIPDLVVDASQSAHAYLVSGADASIILAIPPFGTAPQGGAVVGMGDVDGDGIPDFAASGEAEGVGVDAEVGVMRVLSGADGSVIHSRSGATQGDHYGTAMAGGADLDGDGIGDLLVCATEQGIGAPPPANSGPGYFEAISGANGSLIYSAGGLLPGGRFGHMCELLGDVSGDGVEDFIIGAPFDNNAGAAHVFSGAGGGVLWSKNAVSPQDGFGWGATGVPDLTADGIREVAIGSPDEANGWVRIYSGFGGGEIAAFTGPLANHRFGAAMMSTRLPAGRVALVVAAPGQTFSGTAGRLHVLGDDLHSGCGVGAVGATDPNGPYDVLFANGVAKTGEYRTVSMPVGWPLSITMENPPHLATPQPFGVWAKVGFPGVTDPFISSFGTHCFAPPEFIPSPFVVTVVDSISGNNPNALLPSPGPTPWALNIPSAPDFTVPIVLQGVIVDSGSPTGYAVTNALALVNGPATPPEIDAISPQAGAPGTLYTIMGSGLAGVTMTLGGFAVPLASVSGTQVTFTLPAAIPCDTPLVLTDPAGRTATGVLNPAPVITNTALSSGPAAGGQNFVIIGAFPAGGGNVVTIGGAAVTGFVAQGATSLVVITPPGTPGTAQVVVTTAGGCTATTTYTYL